MKKVIVIGCPGSGKSTFSKALSMKMGLPLFHLDMLYWNVDKTTVSKDVFMDRLCSVMQNENWIIDGNYLSSMEMRIKASDTVFFLDYPTSVCLDGIQQRKGKPRTDIPWVETADDVEFIDFVKEFNTKTRPSVLALLEKYNDKKIVTFKSRNDADNYLEDALENIKTI